MRGLRSLLSLPRRRAGVSAQLVKASGVVLITGCGFATAHAFFSQSDLDWKWKEFAIKAGLHERKSFPVIALCEAGKHVPQSSVISQTKQHALFLTIHLSSTASYTACLKAISQIEKLVDAICPPDLRSEDDEILYGVGFGPQFYATVQPNGKTRGVVPYEFKARYGPLGDMPSTGGDIFIHAKCHEQGKLYELAQALIASLPKASIDRFEDIYGWVYRNGRDLTGFIDGTANPADEDERFEVAVNPTTGGSYLVTQKWVHRHDVINSTKDQTLEQWMGRTRPDSIFLKSMSPTSHVARMSGGTTETQQKPHRIVRQSQPWGTVSQESGLFFVGYSGSLVALDWMLNRMTGAGDDGKTDDVMRLSRCVASTYWYFPSQTELQSLFHGGSRGLWR